MIKKVVASGFLGFVILIGWGFVVNGVFGINKRINMKQMPNERQIYEVLRESMLEPGRYIINPELTTSEMFPDGMPVFSLHYSGMGHEAAGKLMLLQFAIFLLTPMISVWLLSQTTPKILSSYPRKVLFFIAIGILFALFGDLMNCGIDQYSLQDSLFTGASTIAAWSLVGFVVAKFFRLESNPASDSRVLDTRHQVIS